MCLVNCPDQTMSLIEAIKRENYELADQLIMNRRDLDETNSYGNTPLMLLFQKLRKHKVCLKLITKIIDAGAEVNIKNDDGSTALMGAMYCGYSIYTVRMLIDADAEVNIKNNDGSTALFYALIYICPVYTVRMLIDAGADVNVKANYGWTALYYAVLHNNSIYTVRILIDTGADVNIKNNNGHTAMSYAANGYRSYSIVDAVKMLIEADF